MIDKSKGFVPVWRYLVSEEWEWRQDFKTTFLYVWLTAKANWVTKEWKGRTVLAGQYITSLNHLAEETGLTKSEVRSALNHLCATHYIAHTATKSYSVITIENYEELYTNNTPDSTQTAHESHTNRTPPALTKPRKQEEPLNHETREGADKPRRPRFVPPGEPEVLEYFRQQGSTAGEAAAFYDYYTANGWTQGKGKAIKDWQAAARGWIRRAGQYQRPNQRAGSITDKYADL